MQQAAEFEFRFDGAAVTARSGDTIAAALLANGFSAFRRDGRDAPRGPYCLAGSCFECLVEVAGTPQRVRACLTAAVAGLEVRSARALIELG